MNRFEELTKNWDALRFLRRRGFDTRLTATGEIHTQCPRCHDRQYRLYINKKTKYWICFNCPVGTGKGRGALSFVKYILHCDEPEAVRAIVESSTGIQLHREDDEDEEPRVRKVKEVKSVSLPIGYRELKLPATEKSQAYWDYLVSRKITPTMVREYGMGYCRNGEYRGRIVIPINIFGVRRGFVARTIAENVKRKYLNPAEIHTSELLFNLDSVIDNGSDEVVLVEGVFDALRLPSVGVCTFGKKISNQQMELLAEAGFSKWIFCYDGDALEDAAYYAAKTPPFVKCYRAKLPDGFDPGNAPPTVLSKAIREAEYWNLGSIA